MALTSFLRRSYEKLFGRWYEGLQMPERYSDIVVDFANRNPRGTRAEWISFCQELARQTYRAGWQRGYENVERDADPEWRRIDPAVLADAHDPSWRESRGIDLLGNPGFIPGCLRGDGR